MSILSSEVPWTPGYVQDIGPSTQSCAATQVSTCSVCVCVCVCVRACMCVCVRVYMCVWGVGATAAGCDLVNSIY